MRLTPTPTSLSCRPRNYLDRHKALIPLLLALLIITLSGCSGTFLIKDNQALQTNLEQEYSTVYILREKPKYLSGLPNQAISIDINGHEIGNLSFGEYIMLRIKPTEGTIRFTSMDTYGAIHEPRELSGEETFNFAAGQTNFIRTRFIDGEFRGAYFVPERIEFNLARELAKELKPYKIEKGSRITDL